MFSSSKKFLMPSRASRAEKKGGRLRPADTDSARTDGQAEAALERVRLAMSGAMQACLDGDKGGHADMLQRQLRSARDLDTLWYLRPGLMNVIAVQQGEVAARDCLVALTALFKQHPSTSRSARPGAF
jgi:hypothetical protein